jgi:hypothetical protein
MVFSLSALDGASFKTMRYRLYSRDERLRLKNFNPRMAGTAAY